MFESLRKMIVPIIVIVLLFFVAMIVLEWGLDITGRSMGGQANYAGAVNGQNISWDTYNRVYQQLYQNESQRSDYDVPDSKVRELEQTAWNQLVHDHLLAQEASKNNIVVTEKELYSYLRMQPPTYLQQVDAFQTNGQFDYNKYVQAMADPQWASFWAQIEPGIRTEIERLKMQEIVVQTVSVSETELKQSFLEGFEKVKIGLVNISQNRYAGTAPAPTEEQLRQYFELHKDKYKLDERAILNVAMIEKKPTEEDWSSTGARLRVIYDSVVAGADFAEMARAYSQDGSASAGGDLGWFGRGQMVAEFDQRSFSMKEGDISEPFRTQFGWHIIKHMGYRDTVLTPGSAPVHQAHAAHILLRVEPTQESLDAAFQKLSDVQLAAEESGFKQAASEAGLEVKPTTPFTRKMSIPMIGFDAAADSFAFQNQPGAVSQVMENNSAFYILEVAERLPAGDAQFDEAKPRVTQEVRRETIAKMCRDEAEKVVNMARGGMSLEAAAKANGLLYNTTDWLTRNSYQSELGRDPVAISAAFSMNTPGEIVGPVSYSAGAAVMMLIEKQSPELTLFNEKRDSIYNQVMSAKQQEMYSRWYEGIFQTAKIENNVARVNRGAFN